LFFSSNTNCKEAAAAVVNSMKRYSQDPNVYDKGYAAPANLALKDNDRGLINVAGTFIHDCQKSQRKKDCNCVNDK